MADHVAAEEITLPLSALRPGQSAKVVNLRSTDQGRLVKLSTLGLAPGSVVRLQQRSPAFIVWVGETQVSLDGDVAKEILVQTSGNRLARSDRSPKNR